MLANRVYDDDFSVDGDIDVTDVPVSFRSCVQSGCNKVNTIMQPEDIFETREEAARELTIILFHKQSELSVAMLALEHQYDIIKAGGKDTEARSKIHHRLSEMRVNT